MDSCFQDIKHSLRVFARNPGFTLAAMSTLAVEIAASVATFSAVDTVLLRPAPYPEAERLVLYSSTTSQGPNYRASIMKFDLWRRQTAAFESVAAYRLWNGEPGTDSTEQLQSAQVSLDYFRTFGSLPLAKGRTFTAGEELPNGPRVAVISDALSKGRDIGSSISLNGKTYEVIGTLAPGARTEKDPPTDVWIPLQIDLNSTDRNHFLPVAGRLKLGVTPASANAQLHITASELQRQYPDVASEYAVTPIRDAVIGDVALSLWILLGAVTFVLLIACSNVANLLLIRGAGRERDIGVRMAIVASGARILRQFITERVVLSTAAGAIGLVLGTIGIHALLGLNPGDIPRIGEQGAADIWTGASSPLLRWLR